MCESGGICIICHHMIRNLTKLLVVIWRVFLRSFLQSFWKKRARAHQTIYQKLRAHQKIRQMAAVKWTYLQCMLRLLEAVEAVWLEREIGAKLGVVIFYWRYFARVWVVSVVIVIRWGRKAVSPATKKRIVWFTDIWTKAITYQLLFTFSLLLSKNRHFCNIFFRPLHALNFNDWIREKNRALWFDRKICRWLLIRASCY